jgi:hypothetical protein
MADIVDLGDNLRGRFVWLLPGCREVYLSTRGYYEKRESGRQPNHQLVVGKFDPATGQPVGEPIVLGPDFLNYDETKPAPVDISPSGTLAVMNEHGKTAEELARIWVFEPGAAAPRRPEKIPGYAKWFAFGADNRLLLWNQGKLEAWDIDGTAPAYSVGEKLGLPMLISPARNWVVATVNERYLEAFDAASGKTLGRFGAEGKWHHLTVSPDGKRLSGVRYAGPPNAGGPSLPTGPYDLHIWDLTTGSQTTIIANASYYGPSAWLGPQHFYNAGRVYDVQTRTAVAKIDVPTPVPSPDGRLWFNNRNTGQAFTAEISIAPPDAKPAFDAKTPVKLEVTGPRSAEALAALTAGLTAGGHAIGESQWKARQKSEELEAGSQVFDNQQTYNVPQLLGTLELVAPDGTSVAKVNYSGQFSKDKSRYLVKTKSNDPQQPMTTIYTYNFGSKAPREAMLDECWERMLEQLQSKVVLGTVWEVNGKYLPLPVALPFQLPPGVKPNNDTGR